jgi:hypothetical protein
MDISIIVGGIFGAIMIAIGIFDFFDLFNKKDDEKDN